MIDEMLETYAREGEESPTGQEEQSSEECFDTVSEANMSKLS